MKFISIGDDVFISFFDLVLNYWIGFGKVFEIFDEFGEILRVFVFNSDADNRRDGEFYRFDGVRIDIFFISDGCIFLDELIEINYGDGVIVWYVVDSVLMMVYV